MRPSHCTGLGCLYTTMRTGFYIAAIVTAVAGSPTFHNMLVLEQRSDVPVGFVKGSAALPSTMLNLRLALKQNNMAGLEEALYNVSTPGSALYGQHLTKDEVRHFLDSRSSINADRD